MLIVWIFLVILVWVVIRYGTDPKNDLEIRGLRLVRTRFKFMTGSIYKKIISKPTRVKYNLFVICQNIWLDIKIVSLDVSLKLGDTFSVT